MHCHVNSTISPDSVSDRASTKHHHNRMVQMDCCQGESLTCKGEGKKNNKAVQPYQFTPGSVSGAGTEMKLP